LLAVLQTDAIATGRTPWRGGLITFVRDDVQTGSPTPRQTRESQMAKVLLLDNTDRSFPGYADAADVLTGGGHQLVDPGGRLVPEDEVVSLIGDADGVIVGGVHPLHAREIDAAPRLRHIVRAGIGLDKIDVATASTRGISVTNTAGSNAASVADHTFALILGLLRDLVRFNHKIRGGTGWVRRPLLGQLEGQRIGVVGVGNVGRAVVRRAAAGFGMDVIGHDLVPDPSLEREYRLRYTSLHDLLATCPIVTLHVPLTPLTANLIGDRELAIMPRGGVLVNTARGGILDEEALVRALSTGHLAGAGIDAWRVEPAEHSELFALPNVLATPHVGGNSPVSSYNARVWAAERICAALSASPQAADRAIGDGRR
jgi:phosphoglycerate dehydrogenase-like enzyme